ncbi:Irc6p LALA0_S06e07998g [Lachancea lanzarotensis]|uniref:Increased recombination centers protein 6 n=1 Tax=Lachancea lanzarotensis TaxID=1245769 RepID=A0A0C7N4U3_9SACH|nr:uncharacterized protein LALA0_S06e07998g [Lachancea lanzarotensis]CEP62967.1 LALA0S06e07998g1_1 [Lachancea lanzarotensis]
MSGQAVAAEFVYPPRNKILVVFDHQVSAKDAYLSKIFNLNPTADTQIYRNIKWSTKYYNVLIDVYVDYVDGLKSWVDDFCSHDFEELRKALAGCVFIRQCKDGDEGLTAISKIGQTGVIEEGFLAILATEFDATQERLLAVEGELLAHGVEMTAMRSTETETEVKNEYGELSGIARIKEIIDTFQWDHELLHREPNGNENIPSKGITNNSQMPALDDVMGKLQEARAKFLTIDSSEEREAFAREMADEISELL